jgi:CheY-like chemotaxis protein
MTGRGAEIARLGSAQASPPPAHAARGGMEKVSAIGGTDGESWRAKVRLGHDRLACEGLGVEQQPAVIVMDFAMPGTDGISATHRLILIWRRLTSR